MLKKNISMAIVAVIFVMLTITTSLAWYRPLMTDFGNAEISGTIKTSYFERGSGTEAEPYIIARPAQMYNFAWLQYLGYLDSIDGNQVYVALGDMNDGSSVQTLDMTGYVLPPVGTVSHPYTGNFTGNGRTISNLTVSNDADPVQGLKDVPDMAYKVENEKKVLRDDAEIIGFFGVVGSYDGNAVSFTPSITNVTLDNLTIETKTENCLVGFVGGYVNGTVDRVGVSNSNLAIYSTGNVDGFNHLSESMLFGYCEQKNGKGEAEYFSEPEEAKIVDEKGGSFDIEKFFYNVKDLNAKATRTVSGLTIKSDSSLYYYGNDKGDDTQHLFYDASEGGTILPLNDDDTQNNGYIVGSDNHNVKPKGVEQQMLAVTRFNAKLRLTSDIYNYDNSKDQVSFYIRTAPGQANDNKVTFTRVDGSIQVSDPAGAIPADRSERIQAIAGALIDNLSSDGYVKGIHYLKTTEPSTGDLTFNYDAAAIKNYYKYPDNLDIKLPVGAIDFIVPAHGYVTAVMGTYLNGWTSSDRSTSTTASTSFFMFTLYKVTRDSSGNITSITKVPNVYDGSSSNTYIGTNGSNSDLRPCALYYFEIEVDEGEYLLANANNKKGDELVYLDVFSGGTAGGGSTDTETIKQIKQYIYSMPVATGADYVSNGAAVATNAPMSAVITIDDAGQYAASKTGSNISVTPADSIDVSYVKQGLTLNGDEFELELTDPENPPAGWTKKVIVWKYNYSSKELTKDGDVVTASDYPDILAKFGSVSSLLKNKLFKLKM